MVSFPVLASPSIFMLCVWHIGSHDDDIESKGRNKWFVGGEEKEGKGEIDE